MTSASWLPQNGQRGAERGFSASGRGFRTGDSVTTFFQAAEHVEGVPVDGAGLAAAADRVPPLPVQAQLRLRTVELGRQPPPQLVAVGPEPLGRLLPGLLDRRVGPDLLQPAAPVEEVVALL